MEDYLQEGFVPAKATAARLRSTLMIHEIPFAGLKKAQLIQAVEEKVMPLVPRLREEHMNVEPSSEGIIDVHGNGQPEKEESSDEKKEHDDSDGPASGQVKRIRRARWREEHMNVKPEKEKSHDEKKESYDNGGPAWGQRKRTTRARLKECYHP